MVLPFPDNDENDSFEILITSGSRKLKAFKSYEINFDKNYVSWKLHTLESPRLIKESVFAYKDFCYFIFSTSFKEKLEKYFYVLC